MIPGATDGMSAITIRRVPSVIDIAPPIQIAPVDDNQIISSVRV